MTLTRRRVVAAGLAAPALLRLGTSAAYAARELKLSHQFPGGSIDEGDFRDRMCRKFALAVNEQSKGELSVAVYPGSSLMKTAPQFSALKKGVLDLSLYPGFYAAKDVPEMAISLMPGLVTSYAQAIAWKKAGVGKRLIEVLDAKGIILISWVWQSGSMASRDRPLHTPEDAKGLKVRGGSREMDLMMAQAGATPVWIASNESYSAMQTGACDAFITSATSLISFRVQELAKHLSSGRERTYWLVLEPIMMSKAVFVTLPKDQQDMIMTVGAEMEAFGQAGAKADDKRVEEVFAGAGAKVKTLDEATLGKWRDLARETAWKDFAARSSSCAELLALAEKVA